MEAQLLDDLPVQIRPTQGELTDQSQEATSGIDKTISSSCMSRNFEACFEELLSAQLISATENGEGLQDLCDLQINKP